MKFFINSRCYCIFIWDLLDKVILFDDFDFLGCDCIWYSFVFNIDNWIFLFWSFILVFFVIFLIVVLCLVN